jgi:hypothetical protein
MRNVGKNKEKFNDLVSVIFSFNDVHDLHQSMITDIFGSPLFYFSDAP